MGKDLAKRLVQTASMGGFVYRLTGANRLFLTFDDGPDEHYTPQVLQVLQESSNKCTFFLVGERAVEHPELVAEIHARGHRIGLHTYSHTCLDQMSREKFDDEVTRNQDAISRVTGSKPVILRPPLGRLRGRNLLWAARRHLRIIHYTITTNDWKATRASDVVKCVPFFRLNGGEIISMHDNNPHTVEALGLLLEEFQGRGFSCHPILI